MQRLTSSYAPFVNRGQRARSHAEIYVVLRAVDLCQYLPMKLGGRQKYPSGYPYKQSFAIRKTQRMIACKD